MAYIYDLTDTWNAGGTTFNGIKLNVTDSASAVSSKLVTLQTNGTEHFSVTKAGVGYVSGKLGVGTVSPAIKLQVSDVDQATARIGVQNVNGQNYHLVAGNPGASNSGFAIFDATSSATRMYLDSTGNVGIGTSAPAFKLDVSSAGTSLVRYTGPEYAQVAHSDGVRGIYTQVYNNAAVLGTDTSTPLLFSPNNTERMRIDASGNLLVGTTTAVGLVSAVKNGGDIYYASQTASGGYCYTSSAANNGGTYYHMLFSESGTARGTITSNGSTVSYNTSSDYRLKDIGGPIVNSGAYIDALKPVQGSWKADGSRFIGLLAHEVQEVSETPIATGEKDGEAMQAMDYSAPEIIANLIAELQSLRARVAQLEGN